MYMTKLVLPSVIFVILYFACMIYKSWWYAAILPLFTYFLTHGQSLPCNPACHFTSLTLSVISAMLWALWVPCYVCFSGVCSIPECAKCGLQVFHGWNFLCRVVQRKYPPTSNRKRSLSHSPFLSLSLPPPPPLPLSPITHELDQLQLT